MEYSLFHHNHTSQLQSEDTDQPLTHRKTFHNLTSLCRTSCLFIPSFGLVLGSCVGKWMVATYVRQGVALPRNGICGWLHFWTSQTPGFAASLCDIRILIALHCKQNRIRWVGYHGTRERRETPIPLGRVMSIALNLKPFHFGFHKQQTDDNKGI